MPLDLISILPQIIVGALIVSGIAALYSYFQTKKQEKKAEQ